MINAVRNLKINNINCVRRIFSPKVAEKNITTTIKTSIPIVSVPIIACLKPTKIRTNIRETNKNIEQANHNQPDDVTWNEKQSRHLLKKNGITKKAEQDRLIREDGKLTDEGNRRVIFKGHEEVTMKEVSETSNYNNVDTDLSSIDSELSALDTEHAQLAADSVSAQEAIESGLLDEVGISDLLAQITDHPGVAVATGVAAEILPGTRFLKPAKDFLDGDFAKAGIGAATRLGEMLLSPLKWGYVLCYGVVGGTIKLMDPDAEQGGVWKNIKKASHSWAKGRDNLENIFIDRETSGEKKSRLKREAEEKFAEEIRKVEAKKDELKEKRQQLEAQERARMIEAQRRQEELEKLEADLKEKERRHKCYLRERAKRMNPEIQKIKTAQAERRSLKFKEYEKANEELMQIKQQCIIEQSSLKNEQITKYGKSQAKKRDKHPIMELDYRFVYITKILSQLDSYMKQKHLLEDIQFLDILKNPSDIALSNLKKIIEQFNEKLGRTSRRSRF